MTPTPSFNTAVGLHFHRSIKAQKKTQEHFADYLDLSQASVSRLCKGEQRWNADLIHYASTFLDIAPDRFIHDAHALHRQLLADPGLYETLRADVLGRKTTREEPAA